MSRSNGPQSYRIKVRRGVNWTWVKADGLESQVRQEARVFESHRDATMISQEWLRRSDVDGTEVEVETI